MFWRSIGKPQFIAQDNWCDTQRKVTPSLVTPSRDMFWRNTLRNQGLFKIQLKKYPSCNVHKWSTCKCWQRGLKSNSWKRTLYSRGTVKHSRGISRICWHPACWYIFKQNSQWLPILFKLLLSHEKWIILKINVRWKKTFETFQLGTVLVEIVKRERSPGDSFPWPRGLFNSSLHWVIKGASKIF